MNVHQFPLNDCQREQPESDPVGQAIAAFSSAAEHLMGVALKNRDRIANEADFEIVCHGMTQAQLVASLIECRMIANAAVGS